VTALNDVVARHTRWGFWKCFHRLRRAGHRWKLPARRAGMKIRWFVAQDQSGIHKGTAVYFGAGMFGIVTLE
jgi:hypothetical protein